MAADTIVAAYDGSEGSKQALDRAVSDAHFKEAHLVVVVVFPLPTLDPLGPHIGANPYYTPDQEYERSALRVAVQKDEVPPAMRGTVEEAKERIGQAGEVMWRYGDPAGTIVAVARERDATQIILGEHHHNALVRLLGGDVAASVRNNAPCEVVVVAEAS